MHCLFRSWVHFVQQFWSMIFPHMLLVTILPALFKLLLNTDLYWFHWEYQSNLYKYRVLSQGLFKDSYLEGRYWMAWKTYFSNATDCFSYASQIYFVKFPIRLKIQDSSDGVKSPEINSLLFVFLFRLSTPFKILCKQCRPNTCRKSMQDTIKTKTQVHW